MIWLAPVLKIVGSSVVVAGIWGGANVVKETGDAIENAGEAAQKSVSFMDRVIVLTVIGGALYVGAKVLK